MSEKTYNLVRDHAELYVEHKLPLTVLAVAADDTGAATMSLAELSRKSRYSPLEVSGALETLNALGVIQSVTIHEDVVSCQIDINGLAAGAYAKPLPFVFDDGEVES
ncbi:hypothetical protein [Corynebacterium aquilae]|uniref:Uncharacterized protein n=1 Tax=Corynebacterium aquilae DSM 44791 TaxID=1431546 RepID=A0A1L7CEC9_9CORY|nr:hypothetical protein [Corynebacterium aquilae]APT84222.1 hypothetical protein CAQU_03090 [Corynebacterium aquilae DSM 44791]